MPRPEKPVDQETGRPATFDHLRKKKPARQPVDIVFDQDAAEDYNDLVKQMEMATARAEAAVRMGDTVQAERLDADAAALKVKAEQAAQDLRDSGAVVRFVFEGIGAHAFDALIDEHPPTDEQKAKADKEGLNAPRWNQDTFMPELIAACCVEPTLTVDQVQELWKSPAWNDAELSQLANAAHLVNVGRATVDLGKGFGRTPSTGQSSDTA